MKKWFNPVTLIGLFVVAMGLVQLVPKFFEPRDIWWTPRSMALSLQDSRDRVEVFVADKLLRDRVADRSLHLVAEDGTARPVQADDIRLRLNNWDARRADLYWQAMFSAAYLALGVAMLVVGLFFVPKERRSEPPPASAP